MNSRWSTKPITRNGKAVSIRPEVPGNIAILSALARHGTLTLLDLSELLGRPYDPIQRRVTKLKRQPFELVTPHRTQRLAPHQWHYGKQAFHLTPKGEAFLAEKGHDIKARPSKHFLHSVSSSQTSASFELGAKMAGLEYLQLPMPIITANDHRVIPDGGLVGLGRNDRWRLVCWETDMGTEPMVSKKDRQHIAGKFSAYLALLGQKLYETHWGVPNCTVVFTTTTNVRMESMRKLLHSMTADYQHCFRFYVLPVLTQVADRPPRGWAVSELNLAPQGV